MATPLFPLSVSLRLRRTCGESEITSVGISPCTNSISAIYTASLATQSWVDVFDTRSQRGLSKMSGSYAAFAPQSNNSNGRMATVRDWTVQLPGGVDHHHSSTVLVRDVVSGKTLVEIKEAGKTPVAWSWDGKFIAAGEGRCRMGVWDARTGGRVGRVVSHIDTITHAAFTADMKLVTLSRDGTLRISNPFTAKTIARLEMEAATNNPRALSVTPDGNTIISIWGTTAHVWRPANNEVMTYNLNSTRHTEGWPLGITPSGRHMACWTEDGFDIMDVGTGAIIFEEKSVASSGAALVTAGAWSMDGRVLVLGRMNGVVEVWDIEEKEMKV